MYYHRRITSFATVETLVSFVLNRLSLLHLRFSTGILVVSLEDVGCLFDLADEIVGVFGLVDELFVVDLQQHSSDLGGSRWFSCLDKWLDNFTEILLLLLSV